MEKQTKPLTEAEILAMDFYDFCGSWAVFMTDEDKIKYWRECESLYLKK